MASDANDCMDLRRLLLRLSEMIVVVLQVQAYVDSSCDQRSLCALCWD